MGQLATPSDLQEHPPWFLEFSAPQNFGECAGRAGEALVTLTFVSTLILCGLGGQHLETNPN